MARHLYLNLLCTYSSATHIQCINDSVRSSFALEIVIIFVKSYDISQVTCNSMGLGLKAQQNVKRNDAVTSLLKELTNGV